MHKFWFSAWVVLIAALLSHPLLSHALTVEEELIIDGIDAASILLVYTWGMGAVLTMWALGYAAGMAVAVIKAL